jgi:hypothetical protein
MGITSRNLDGLWRRHRGSFSRSASSKTTIGCGTRCNRSSGNGACRCCIGLIFGLAMFYKAAFIILAPLVVTIAAEAKVPSLKLAIPAAAAATTAHSPFPPQPGPVALINAYHADTGTVYLYGLLVAIPPGSAPGSSCRAPWASWSAPCRRGHTMDGVRHAFEGGPSRASPWSS